MARHYHTRSLYTPRSIRKLQRKTKRKIIFTIAITIALIYLTITKGVPLLIDGISIFRGNNPTISPAPKINVTLAPPTLNIPFDATNSGVISISGYSIPGSEVELYIDEKLVDTIPTDTNGNFVFPSAALNLGLNNITGKVISTDGTKSLPSKVIVIDYSSDKPTLDIFEPADNKTQSGSDTKVKISGKTDRADIQVQVNSTPVYVNSEGKFETLKDLIAGDNQITITATNKYGSTTQVSRKVIFAP